MDKVFQNRKQAARALASGLAGYRGKQPLVLGIPRGGVPMARIIARELKGDLDVVLVHKLRAPYQPELAIGAIDEQGRLFLTPAAEEAGATKQYLKREVELELAELRKQRKLYTPGQGGTSPRGRIAIVVDDGIATGSTLMAALQTLRACEPERLLAAVGVAPKDSLRRLRKHADEIVCGYDTDDFVAVGEFYGDFDPVSDEEVLEALKACRLASSPRARTVAGVT